MILLLHNNNKKYITNSGWTIHIAFHRLSTTPTTIWWAAAEHRRSYFQKHAARRQVGAHICCSLRGYSRCWAVSCVCIRLRLLLFSSHCIFQIDSSATFSIADWKWIVSDQGIGKPRIFVAVRHSTFYNWPMDCLASCLPADLSGLLGLWDILRHRTREGNEIQHLWQGRYNEK